MTGAAAAGVATDTPWADGGLCALLGVDRQQVARLVTSLAGRGMTVATAESLTAGLLAATLTEIPGSSAVLRGGIVCYATDLKHTLVGVDAGLLDRAGPVDPDVAIQLADGARAACGATIGVGLTGVAGPGPQDGVPPGTVFVAVSMAGHVVQAGLPGQGAPTDRWQVRAAAVRCALRLLQEMDTATTATQQGDPARPPT
jgi:nicotinamide-nucleotide amidase